VKPASGGIYTTVGTYDHTELVAMLAALSKQTKVPLTNLTKTFGMHHFAEFTAAYPYLFDGLNSPFELLEKSIGLFMRKCTSSIRVRLRLSLNATH
jgi:hypothetical protein